MFDVLMTFGKDSCIPDNEEGTATNSVEVIQALKPFLLHQDIDIRRKTAEGFTRLFFLDICDDPQVFISYLIFYCFRFLALL